MTIWIDADACPKPIKDILFRAANRTKTPLVLVANRPLNIPASPWITSIQVELGFDAADKYIIEHLQAHDLVITADIPLAAHVIDHQGVALNPRGELYTQNNVKQCLSVRNMMEQLRSTGERTKGPSPLGLKDKNTFAKALDKLLTLTRINQND